MVKLYYSICILKFSILNEFITSDVGGWELESLQLDCLFEQKEFDIRGTLEGIRASSWDDGGIQMVKQKCSL